MERIFDIPDTYTYFEYLKDAEKIGEYISDFSDDDMYVYEVGGQHWVFFPMTHTMSIRTLV